MIRKLKTTFYKSHVIRIRHIELASNFVFFLCILWSSQLPHFHLHFHCVCHQIDSVWAMDRGKQRIKYRKLYSTKDQKERSNEISLFQAQSSIHFSTKNTTLHT